VKSDSILEELWAVKDKLAREAGYDVDRFVQNLRQWELAHPQTGRVIGNADELRQYGGGRTQTRGGFSLNPQ